MNVYQTGKTSQLIYMSAIPFAGCSPVADVHPVRQEVTLESLEEEFWENNFQYSEYEF